LLVEEEVARNQELQRKQLKDPNPFSRKDKPNKRNKIRKSLQQREEIREVARRPQARAKAEASQPTKAKANDLRRRTRINAERNKAKANSQMRKQMIRWTRDNWAARHQTSMKMTKTRDRAETEEAPKVAEVLVLVRVVLARAREPQICMKAKKVKTTKMKTARNHQPNKEPESLANLEKAREAEDPLVRVAAENQVQLRLAEEVQHQEAGRVKCQRISRRSQQSREVVETTY